MNKHYDMEALLKELPEAAESHMGGLTATPFMKAKIDRAVAQKRERKHPLRIPRWMPAAACAALVLVLAIAAYPGTNGDDPDNGLVTMNSNTLGEATAVPGGAHSADLGNGSVFITRGSREPDYRSVWSPVEDGSFPLIGVNGRYYRMLTTPDAVSGSLRGGSLGAIAEFTTEPSLSGTDVVLSNCAATSSDVYAISGMEGTLVTAQVDGVWRAFQRVSFNGNALRGNESLSSTLQVDGRVVAMELTGVGTVTDPNACQALARTLLRNATYESSGSISSRQALLIELDNGLVLQLAVRGDKLAACGVWSCPEFFEDFADYAE